MADSDASGVLDTRPALEREFALLRAGDVVLSPEVSLSLDGARLVLPFAADQIDRVVDRAYRAGGFAALQMIHDAAVRQIDDISGRIREREEMAKVAFDLIPENGYQGPAEELLAERRFVLGVLEEDRARRLDQLATLREAIDGIAEGEEVAQRWYEGKLLASIAADFARRQAELEKAWRTYRIGDARTGLTVLLKDTVSSEGLAILAKDDMDTIVVGDPSSTRVQGQELKVTVPAVLKATYDLASAQHKYKEAFRGATRAAAIRGGKVDPRNMPAWAERQAYARLVAEHSEKHFIALPAHSGLVRTSRDAYGFDRKRYETAVIDAFLHARDSMPELLREMQANALFNDTDTVAVIGREGMPRTAAEVLIAARYRERADVVLVKPKREEPEEPDIYHSPWLQKPFHDRLMQLAAVLRIEEMQATAASAAAPPVVDPTAAKAPANAAEAGVDPKVLERMQREVAHLRPVFKEPTDRQMLLWSTSLGTLVSRGRYEVSDRLEERIERLAELRAAVQRAVGIAGLILIPFTGGQSVIVAGAIDAMLVANRTVEDVQKWIAARQFSQIALDQIASMHWREPETSMLVGQFLEAGFEIAGDLIQAGAAGVIFDMIGAAELTVTVVDTSVELLKGGRP